MARVLGVFFLILQVSGSLWAKEGISKAEMFGGAPIQIDAEKGIQCDKDNKICKAFNAKVIHKEFLLQGKLLKVFFSDKDGLQRVEAYGDVYLKSGAEYEAHGGEGSFELEKGIAILKKSAQAVDLKNSRSLKGENIKLILKKNKDEKLEIERVDASTNVQIKTQKELAKADKGSYVSGKDFVVLTGNVKITNKDGQMSGDRAEMNLKTGVSQIKSTKGPVRVYLNSKSSKMNLKS